MRPGLVVRRPALLALVLVFASACGDGKKAVTTTTTTTEARLTKQEYIRQGDAICAESNRKAKSIPPPQGLRQDPIRVYQRNPAYLQQSRAVIQEEVQRLKALHAPLADKAITDQLNAYQDQMLAKYDQFVAAVGSGQRRAAQRAAQEVLMVSNQWGQLARTYGFVECGKEEPISAQP